MKWMFQRAAQVVASGEGWRINCIEHWGVDADRVITIENGSEIIRLLERQQLRAFESSPDPTRPVNLVYLGGFYPWHGVTVLLQAFSKAIQQGADLRLVLIGAGAGFEDVQRLASDLNLADQVTFTGRLTANEYARYLADADIGVSPYCGWEEFSGLKIFDYKAAGLACIASGKDGQPLTVSHGKTGWIVTPCDEKDLCQAIMALSSQRDLLRRMGQAARVEAEQWHGWDHTARQIEETLANVQMRRGKSPA
jgi:glycosyltransferase involved in cell wall biosynthesis